MCFKCVSNSNCFICLNLYVFKVLSEERTQISGLLRSLQIQKVERGSKFKGNSLYIDSIYSVYRAE